MSYASQRRRQKVNRYNNPFHPEDDLENQSETIEGIDGKHNKSKSDFEELNAQIEARMEKENNNFFDKVSDDELDDNKVENSKEIHVNIPKEPNILSARNKLLP